MLKQSAIDTIAKLLKTDATKLKEAITAEAETDITIADDLQLFTGDELTARDKNKYNEGTKAGREIKAKELKKKFSIEIAGEDIDSVVEAISEKVKKEASANPDARVTELENTLKTAKEKLKEVAAEKEKLIAEKTTLESDTKLLSLFPSDRIETMTNEEYLALVKSKIKIETREGKEVVIKDGQPVLSAGTLDPVPVNEAIAGYFKERKWVKEDAGGGAAAGRGGGNSNTNNHAGKYLKLSELKTQLEKDNINLQGEEGTRRLQAALKDNPDIDMNS